MKILIKFPTRNRVNQFFKVLDEYYDYSTNLDQIEFQITIDDDDLSMNNKMVIDRLNTYKNLTYNIGKSLNKIHAVNRDLKINNCDIILLASDDMHPVMKGYDEIIRENMKKLYPDTDGVLWFNDGNRKDLNTLCILGTKYYNRFGYIYHPDYKSLWADNEFMDVANILKKQTFIDIVIIHHKHPDWGFGKRDEIHHLNSINNSYDKNIYLKHKLSNFNLHI